MEDVLMVNEGRDAGELLVELLKVGNEAAKQHGYPLEGKKVAIGPTADGWKVYYSVVPPPGKGVLGGDFTVIVNPAEMKVVRTDKGR
jgi:hypothetical protein